jgi:hypothetical protein
MPRETKETTIEGITYEVMQLGGKVAGDVMFRLGRAFGAVLGGLKNGELRLDMLEQADFDWLREVMIKETKVGIVDTVGGGKVRMMPLATVFDEHFAGPEGIRAQFQWLLFCLEANFGPLQDAVGKIIRGVKAPSLSKPPTAPSGSVGDSSSAPG